MRSSSENNRMRFPRASGVLLHPTSLPGRHGIGDLGKEAHGFVNLLAATGQRWWQILPVGPTGYGNSPYQSHSSFAGNRLLIDLDNLMKMGWLPPEACPHDPPFPVDHVDFDAVTVLKDGALRVAFEGFEAQGAHPRFEEFITANRSWLDDYVLYQALKDAHGSRPWFDWEPELIARDPSACAQWRRRLDDAIRYHEFVQYAFELQWQELRGLCREKGVMLIGDLPIFVAHDSADVWANPKLFYLDEKGYPLVVAGVPPDYFSETGQLWGNPLYRWDAHAADDYSWWAARLRFLLGRVDIVRIDHFRGFEAYWEIPAGSATAAPGRWVEGPGRHFFEALRRRLGSLPLIAEDLGMITPGVEALRDDFSLPGMRVLQFGFGPDAGADKELPHRFIPHCVVYTGTHDNDTTLGWFTATDVATTQSPEEIAAERAFACRYLNTRGDQIHWDMIRLAFSSVADTAIIPLQDILGLDSRARMNLPGTVGGNWGWRFRSGKIDRHAQARLAELTALFGRWNGTVPKEIDPRTNPAPAAGSASLEAPQTAP
jgi:4-alpha-glucanotransferase